MPSSPLWRHHAAMVKNARDITPFALRMQPELRAQVEASAEKAGRSINSEIVNLISIGLSAVEFGNREDDIRARLTAIESVLDRGGRPAPKQKRGKKR